MHNESLVIYGFILQIFVYKDITVIILQMVKIVLTGGCGFIGHHFAEYIHKNTDWEIIIFDKLTYASMGLNRLRNNKLYYSDRVKIYTIDLCNDIAEGIKKEIGNDIDYIVHMAAETHVDNSIH